MTDSGRASGEKPSTRRLRRLLNLIPIIHAHPGIQMEQLMSLSGFRSRRELESNLEQLLMFGQPPFSPADYVDIYIDEQDRVFLELTQGLERPLDLNPQEYAALYRLLVQESQNAVVGEQHFPRRLKTIMDQLSNIPLDVDSSSPYESRKKAIQQAMADSRQIRFLYRSLSSSDPESRRVDPWATFSHNGQAYLLGFCHMRHAPRHFHLERIQSLEILDVTVEMPPPENLAGFLEKSPIFTRKNKGIHIELLCTAEILSAISFYFEPDRIEPLEEPGIENTASSLTHRVYATIQDSLWLRNMLRALGENVVLIRPEHIRESLLQDLQQLQLPAPIC